MIVWWLIEVIKNISKKNVFLLIKKISIKTNNKKAKDHLVKFYQR